MLPLSHTLRSIASMPHIFLGGQPGERAGDGLLAGVKLDAERLPHLALRSPAFQHGERIPQRFAADGDGISPPLLWGEIGPRVVSLALIVEDPDAPTPQPFVHWLLYNLSPAIGGLPEGLLGEAPVALNGGVVGRSSMLRATWAPCAPPEGDVAHHYHFQLFGLDRELDLGRKAGRRALLEAMRGHVVAFGDLIGLYQR